MQPTKPINRDSLELPTERETWRVEEERARALADLDLVQRSLVGNVQAIEQLMNRLGSVSSMLAAKNARMGRPLDGSELEDVTQEALILIWSKRKSFVGTGPLEAWVYRICTFEYMNRMRKKQRRVRLMTEQEPEHLNAVAAEEQAPLSEYEALHGGLEDVGPPDADVVRLKHFDGLTFDQIAARLSIPSSTAKTQYYRGLEKLRQHLGTSYFG